MKIILISITQQTVCTGIILFTNVKHIVWLWQLIGKFEIENGHVVLEKILKVGMVTISSPLKGACPFLWINMNPLHSRMLCSKMNWIWTSGSGAEDKNVKSLQWQSQMTHNILSEKLTWDKLKSTKLFWCYLKYIAF